MYLKNVLMGVFFLVAVQAQGGVRAVEEGAACLKLAYPSAGGVIGAGDIARVARLLEPAGLCVTLLSMPNKRAALAFRSGRIDGEVGRAEIYEAVLDGTGVRVPVPVATRMVYLFTTDSRVQQATDVKQMEVAYVRGFVMQKRLIDRYGAIGIPGETYETLARLISIGRVRSIMLGEAAIGKVSLPAGRQILLQEVVLYLYLHESRRDLVPLFERHIAGHLAAGGSFLPPSPTQMGEAGRPPGQSQPN